MKRIITTAAILAMLSLTVLAKVDLVTLPAREGVQLTIYNSADLTLVRDMRSLTFLKGLNSLQFSWANTLIDPTSLDLVPQENSDKISIDELSYPPNVRDLGVWHVRSQTSGKTPVEINYLTSGLSWLAFYLGVLSPDEKTMNLEGYVLVRNNSGEDYENAVTRLIVGKVHLLDEISALARREYPYGKPTPPQPPPPSAARRAKEMMNKMAAQDMAEVAAPKEITKEGLSEYFLYTIAGTETIPNGWGKRLPSFTATAVPILNLYKYDEERYDTAVIRFLSLKNDLDHKLGDTPIPGGVMVAYRRCNEEGQLSFEGQSEFKYIPINEKAELNLGAVGNVIVEPKLMDYKTDHYLYDYKKDITGWDEVQTYQVEIKNTRDVPIRLEVTRHFPTQHWELEKKGDYGEYEKVDLNTVKFTVNLAAQSKTTFSYILTTHYGQRAEP